MLFDKQGKIIVGILMSGMIAMPLIGISAETDTPADSSAVVSVISTTNTGLVSDEQVSRLLVEGRKAFQDGDLTAAEKSFRSVIGIDASNAEAQKFLKSISDRSKGLTLSPDAGVDGAKPLAEAKTDNVARTVSGSAEAPGSATSSSVTASGDAPKVAAASSEETATSVVTASSEKGKEAPKEVAKSDAPAVEPKAEAPKSEVQKAAEAALTALPAAEDTTAPEATTAPAAAPDPSVVADIKPLSDTAETKAETEVKKAMGALNSPVEKLEPLPADSTTATKAPAPSSAASDPDDIPVVTGDIPTKVSVTTPAVQDASPSTAQSAFEKGLAAYQAGSLDVAVQWWNYALSLDPKQAQACEYLQRTRGEYEAWVQQHQANAIDIQREGSALDKMLMTVSYDSDGPKTIVEFFQALSLSTDVSFYMTDGVDPDMKITAKFDNVPLNDALDTVILPVGLKWTRSADVITVSPDLSTKFFTLVPEQVAQMKTILESKTLQKMLYGKEGMPPMRNVELALDDRSNMLMVTDSIENIQKVEAFLQDMKVVQPQGLIYKSWKIRPEEGNKIKSLVDALIRTNSDAPYDLERKVVVDGEDLIVKDTAENVAKVEELLSDKNFIKKINDQRLEVATFNLTPREPLPDNPEQVRELAQNVVTVVKTILYSQSTESAAAAEGRRFWYDPNTLQLTVTDYPDNLKVVSDFVRGLPLFGKKSKSEIIFLRHQTSSDLSSLLDRVLGLGAGDVDTRGTAADSNKNSIRKTLRRKQEMTFRDLVVRCIRIQRGGDYNDDTQDTVELAVRTNTNSQDLSLQEYRSQFIDDYEIYAGEIKPSGNSGDGSAQITITYRPGSGYGNEGFISTTGGPTGNQLITGNVVGPDGRIIPTTTSFEEKGLQIETIDNMNALLIRYEDPGDLAEVKSWIEQLDIPVLQVSIETKLVEVNENKAKEYLPELKLNNLGQGISLSDNRLDSTFGDATENFLLPFGPFANNPQSNSLMTAYTALNFVSFGESPVSFNLRMLEAEGVLTLTNGPHVTVENGETADFEIEKYFGSLDTYDASGTGNTSTNNNFRTQSYRPVSLSVSPTITQIGEIRLEISDLELQDLGNNLGDTTTYTTDGSISTSTNYNDNTNDNTSSVFGATAITMNFMTDRRRRTLSTVARVHDGGTIVLGGWNGEKTINQESGVPVLRNLPYLGKLFFNKTNDRTDKTTLLIFLTCNIVKP